MLISRAQSWGSSETSLCGNGWIAAFELWSAVGRAGARGARCRQCANRRWRAEKRVRTWRWSDGLAGIYKRRMSAFTRSVSGDEVFRLRSRVNFQVFIRFFGPSPAESR